MKLFYIPLTRATRPRWLLEEMGLSYELVRVGSGEMANKFEYQNLHPHNKVPVLVDDNVTIFESAAICSYLADQYPEKKLAPSLNSPSRGYYYQWLFYAQTSLEPPVERYIFQVAPDLPEQVLPNSEHTKFSKEEIFQWFTKVCEPLQRALKNNDYLVDNRLTTVDVVTGGVLYWAYKLGMIKEETPIKKYLMQLIERPAFQRAHDEINIYKTVA